MFLSRQLRPALPETHPPDCALLTVALNSVKPRMTPQIRKQDWQHVVSEYQEILQSLESIRER
jgi:hypothetical protein